jgi:hypothetical protein
MKGGERGYHGPQNINVRLASAISFQKDRKKERRELATVQFASDAM